MHKYTENVNTDNKNRSNVHRTVNLDNCVEKKGTSGNFLFVIILNSVTLLSSKFSKIDKIFCQKKGKCEQNNGFRSTIPKISNYYNSL